MGPSRAVNSVCISYVAAADCSVISDRKVAKISTTSDAKTSTTSDPIKCTPLKGHPAQQTPDIESKLVQCWATVFDAGPTLNQHRFNVWCLLGGRNAAARPKS